MGRKVLAAAAVGLTFLTACAGGEDETIPDGRAVHYDLKGYAIDPAINGTLRIWVNTNSWQRPYFKTEIKNGEFSYPIPLVNDHLYRVGGEDIELCVEGTDGTNTYTLDDHYFCLLLKDVYSSDDLTGVLISPVTVYIESFVSPTLKPLAISNLQNLGVNYRFKGFSSFAEANDLVLQTKQAIENALGGSFGRDLTAIEWQMGLEMLLIWHTGALTELRVQRVHKRIAPATSNMTETCAVHDPMQPTAPYTESCTTFRSGAFNLAMLELSVSRQDYNNIYLLDSSLSPPQYKEITSSATSIEDLFNDLYGLPCDTGGNGRVNGDEAYISDIRNVACTFNTDNSGIWDGTITCDIEGTITVGLLDIDSNRVPVCSQSFVNGDKVYMMVIYSYEPFSRSNFLGQLSTAPPLGGFILK